MNTYWEKMFFILWDTTTKRHKENERDVKGHDGVEQGG